MTKKPPTANVTGVYLPDEELRERFLPGDKYVVRKRVYQPGEVVSGFSRSARIHVISGASIYICGSELKLTIGDQLVLPSGEYQIKADPTQGMVAIMIWPVSFSDTIKDVR